MKIFGIPLTIRPFFLLVAGLMGYTRDLPFEFLIEWVVVVFVSILAHELGHALMVRAFGMSPQIMIYEFGGLTSWNEEKDVSPPRHIAISLAGPFAGFIFGGAVVLLGKYWPELFADSLARQTFEDLLWVNFGWGLFNLLPVLPLDGGNVAYSVEQLVTKKNLGMITRVVSLLVAGAVGLWALSVGLVFIAILMGIFAWSNGRALFQALQYERDGGLRSLFDRAQGAVNNDDGAAAVRLAKEALNSARSVEVKEEAQRILLQGLILGSDVEQAKKEADRLRAVYGHAALLRALAGFDRELLPRAIPVIEHAYAMSQSPDLNFTLANALIAAGRLHDALPVIERQQQLEYAAGAYKMLQIAAFHSGEYDLSAEAGRRAFERTKEPEVAYNIGCAEARAGRDDEALAWIERAVDIGYRDGAALAADPDLEALRSRPEFEAIVGRLRESAA